MELAFGLMFVCIVAVLGWAWNKRRSAQQSWHRFGRRHDLEFDNGGLFGQHQIRGEFDGVPVRCYTETRGGGKNSTTYSIYESSLPDGVPFDLVVFEEHLFSGLVDMFGGQDIQVGDRIVDDAFVFRSDRPGEVRAFFDNPGVTEAFRELARSKLSVKIDHGAVRLEEAKLHTSEDELQAAFDRLTSFVETLEAALATDGASPSNTMGAEQPVESSESSGTDSTDEKNEREYAVEW